MVGAGIRQCAARLTFGAGHGIRCGCGTRRKVSAAGRRRNHWGSSTSRLGLGRRAEVQVCYESRHPLGIGSSITNKDSVSSSPHSPASPFFLIPWKPNYSTGVNACSASPADWATGIIPGIPDINMERFTAHYKYSLRPLQERVPCVQLRISCTSLSFSVKYHPNYILHQPLEQLRALFGSPAYFLNVGAAVS